MGSERRTRMTVLVILLVLAGYPGPAGAALPEGNLIENPGAEFGAVSFNATDVAAPDFPWSASSNFTQVAYGTDGFPSLQSGIGTGGASAFFAGGPANASSAATQRVDVSGAAPEIDAGEVAATLSALLGGVAAQDDAARVEATFVDGGNAKLGAMAVGPVLAAERGGATVLVARSATAAIPAGTREVVVVVAATRAAGAYNDGYADNVSLTMSRTPATTPPIVIPAPVDPAPQPPAPGAPVVTAVASALPLVAGRPAVLAAQVDGPVRRLEWDLDGDGKAEVSCPGDQTTLRFRPPVASGARTRAGGFDGQIAVRAIGGPGAGAPFTQSFAVTPAPAATPSGTLGRSLGRLAAFVATKPPVLACGRAADLSATATELTGNQDLSGHRERLAEFAALQCVDRTVTWGTTLRATGCWRPIRTLEQIPRAERDTIGPIVTGEYLGNRATVRAFQRELGLPPGSVDDRYVERALDFADAWVSDGPILLNGVKLTPQRNGRVVFFPQLGGVTSSDASISVGGVRLEHAPAFSLRTQPDAAGRIRIGSGFARSPGGVRGVAGFQLAGDVGIVLTPATASGDAGAVMDARLELPEFLSLAGERIRSNVKLRLTSEGEFVLDELHIGPIDAEIAPDVGIEGLQIDYSRTTREWRGMGKLCFLVVCLDARDSGQPPPGGVVIRDGELQRLFGRVEFPEPGIILFPGVHLNSVGAGLGLNPTRVLGSARVTALAIFEIRGSLALAFPSQAAPYRLTREENGNSFPAHFYGRAFPRFTMALASDAFLKIPLIDETVRLGGAYFLYHAPGYVAFGGGLDFNFFDVVTLLGRADGEFNFASGRFNLGGQLRICVVDIVCAGALSHVSSVGVGGCVSLEVAGESINVGGGVVFSPFDIKLWPLDGCKWSRFYDPRVFGGQARAAQAGGTHTVRVRAGDEGRAVRLDGRAGAPRVRVTAPDGRVLESSDGPGHALTKTIRILRSERLKTTIVGLQDPKPGAYKIEPLPGSAAITKVSEAKDPPDARISARITRRGVRRVITYDIRPRPDQRVTFVETGPDGNRPIATVRGGRGTVAFTPAPGRGPRSVQAQFELAGVRAETKTVARFTPPSARLGRPVRVRVRRRGSTLLVSWPRVAGASRYDIVTTLATGRQRTSRTRRNLIAIHGVSRTSGGRVSVRAVASMRRGALRSVRFRATARRAPSLGPLLRLRRGRG